MKNIILLTISFLSFSSVYAQVVTNYVDKNNTSTTVIEKDSDTDALDVLNSLNIDDYEVNDVVFIRDAAHLEELMGAQKKQQNIPEPIEKEVQTVEKLTKEVTIKEVASVENVTIKPMNPERNPIGEKVKRKRKRTPRWKSDRRGKRSNSTCFRF